MKSLLSAAQDYFSGFIQENFTLRCTQLSENSVSLTSPIPLKDSEAIKLGLLSFLKKRLPNYRFELSHLYQKFTINYYPSVELPPDMLRKIFIHTGPQETVRLLQKIPELKKILSGEHFWYHMMVEQYPGYRKIPKDLINWVQFCRELALLSKKTSLTFDLPMLKEAVQENATEIVKIILQDSRLNLPSIKARAPQGVMGPFGAIGPMGAIGPRGPTGPQGLRMDQYLRIINPEPELIFKEERDLDEIPIWLYNHNIESIDFEVGKTSQLVIGEKSVAVLKMQNVGSFKHPDPLLMLWEKEHLFEVES